MWIRTHERGRPVAGFAGGGRLRGFGAIVSLRSVAPLTRVFTTLSRVTGVARLRCPRRISFKVKLEGCDRDWQDVGNRRQAFYTNLHPATTASASSRPTTAASGTKQGASLDFSIAPAYYQTSWFRRSVAGVFCRCCGRRYQLPRPQLAREFDLTLGERVNERTRIARELHDTLLQSFHGLLLRFQTALDMLPERPAEAKKNWRARSISAAKAITEGRDAVQDLRASTVEPTISPWRSARLATSSRHQRARPSRPHSRVAVEGQPRDLHPIVRDEIYRIAGEALRNAFRHAQATRIEVEIRYDDRQFRLRVRDDGKGIDPEVLADQAGEGHFGLRGMRGARRADRADAGGVE